MGRRLFVSTFEQEADIIGATKAARTGGYKIVDIYTPYAVHGLDALQGLKPSKLPWVCFVFGLAGALAKLWYQIWTSATSWPVNVGGKPLNSVPAFVPVTFEIMVLFAGVGTVIALFILSRLYPGKKPAVTYPGSTDNRFVLILEEKDAAFDIQKTRKLFEQYHVVSVQEEVEPVRGRLFDIGARA